MRRATARPVHYAASPMPFDRQRALFPALVRRIYLNHAGVSPCSTRTVEATSAWLEDLAQNGVANEHRWEELATHVRGLCARLIGASAEEIAYVRNTSHGLGLVAEGLPWQAGDEVAVCTALEYPSNVYPWLHLASRGVFVREIVPDGGGVTPAAVEAAITDRTRLVAVSSVQYATGHRTDLAAIGDICRRRGLLFLVDGIQSVGFGPLDVKRAGIHFLSADSHKWMLGMPGVGFLYVDREVVDRLRPVLVGWHSTTDAWNFDRAHFDLRRDAQKLEEGSPTYCAIAGMGAALEILLDVGLEAVEKRVSELVERLDVGLREVGCETFPPREQRAGILTFTPSVGSGEALHRHLEENGVSLSLRRGRVRASPHFYTRDEEIDRVVALVREWVTSASSAATPS